MFSAAIRPATLAARSIKPASALRALSTSAVRRSGHASPSLFPPGSESGKVPTDDVHATGLERLQILGAKEGVKVFDYEPLDASRLGTVENPVKVFSWDTMRTIGCTGVPAESHELLWMNLEQNKNRRCPECGSVYKLDVHGEQDAHGDAHHH